jgi:hypothetical protein
MRAPGLRASGHESITTGAAAPRRSEALRVHIYGASVEAVGEDVRHLEIHMGHLTYLNEHDQAAWAAGSWQLVSGFTLTGSRDEIPARIDEVERQGVTELATSRTATSQASSSVSRKLRDS